MALRSLSSSSSSSSFSYGFTYEVFLSFRGTDTRFGFTGNLYKALCDSGIHTFIDDRELQGGDEITPSLVKAIEESRIAIPVFSKNYASSSFCLDELVHIIECLKEKGRLVLPVFYDVDPSQVRHHNTGSYGEALAKHEARLKYNKEKYRDNMERLRKWKMALNQAANLSGHHFKLGNEYEHEFIGKIVKEVYNKINHVPLHVADYPTGLEPRVLQVKSLLDVGSDDEVHMVGIYGIGGMGKSTLARAIYNLIADQFEGLCFLHNVRENSAKHGLVHLQEKLLSKTTRSIFELGDVNEGIPIIKQRLHRMKVLLILDDVDELKQLQAMAGGLDWFGHGSRVIITTRDKHLLESHGIERTYEVDELNEEEALELMRWKAFKNNRVDSSYEYNLNRAVTYASGLPLALEVVGSNLFGKNIEEWKSALDQYKRIPQKEIQEILKVSFDALEEHEQNVFLDIACCLKGYGLEKVEDILCAHHGQCMKYHIGVLVEKSLIKINQHGDVTLHDLIEDMGKEIVRQESPKDPGKRSRLWFHEDIVQVLEENLGTSQIEIIHLDFPLSKEVEWRGDKLMKMKKLKTLIIVNARFSKGPEQLPNSLRVLEWRRYPSRGIPSDFCPKKLSICKLQESCLASLEFPSSLQAGVMVSLPSSCISIHHFKIIHICLFVFASFFFLQGFMNMTELNLDKCQYLTRIPDVTGLPNLEKFSFENCENLMTIHNSIGFLSKLKILNAEQCMKLRSFPPLKLSSLEVLDLSFCSSLERFPEILGEMKNITSTGLMGNSTIELPLSFQNLTGLSYLFLLGNELMLPRFLSSIVMMPKLLSFEAWSCRVLLEQNDKLSSMVSSNVQRLTFRNCNLSDEILPIALKWFANVRELTISGSNFTILPECIKEFRFLWRLCLENCKCLREIIGIPPNLKCLSTRGCESLTSSCRSMLLNQELHEAGSTKFFLTGTARIPEWFEHKNRGQSISFWFRNKIPSIALFVVSESMHNPNNEPSFLSINDYQNDLDNGFRICLKITPYHTYLYDLKLQDREQEFMDKGLLKNEWIKAEITFKEDLFSSVMSGNHGFESEGRIITSGIHVFKQRSSLEDIRFTSPYKKRKLDDDGDHYSQ